METQFVPGTRCRATHPISHHKGTTPRYTEGTVLDVRENIGRELITVEFNGARLILFSNEIEPVNPREG